MQSDLIDEIEHNTHENLRKLINSLECCNAETYKKQTVFRFLPGHRNFILRLPAEIERMKGPSKNKQTFTVPPQIIQGTALDQSHLFANQTEQQDGNAEYHAKIESLQNILIEKLTNAGNEKTEAGQTC